MLFDLGLLAPALKGGSLGGFVLRLEFFFERNFLDNKVVLWLYS